MITVIIALIIAGVIIYVANEMEELRRENARLREIISELKNRDQTSKLIETLKEQDESNFDEVVEQNTNSLKQEEPAWSNETSAPQNIEPSPTGSSKEETPQYEETYRKVDEQAIKDSKNVAILTTGAICIILAAIVFLVSTWSVIPNILKTIVLMLVTLVFLGGSYIAENKFHLDKTAKTFFYIAMAYIPICLLSISVLRVFGNYLSIYGEGRWIYFFGCAILLSVIYYMTYKEKKNECLLVGSILSQMFGIISISLIFSSDMAIIGINLLLYNILLILLTKKEIFVTTYNIILIIVTFISIYVILEQSISIIIMLFLLTINFLILLIKRPKDIYLYMFHIILLVLGAYTLNMYKSIIGTNASYLLLQALIVIVYSLDCVALRKNKKINYIDCQSITTLGATAILHIASIIDPNMNVPYLISICQLILLGISYMNYGKNPEKESTRDIIGALIPIYFIATGINIINIMNGSYHMYVLFSILTFIISELLKRKEENLYAKTFIISNAFIVLTYIAVMANNAADFINDIVYSIVLFGIYCYCYKINHNKIFKYMAYIVSNYVILTFAKLISADSLIYYIPTITTSIIVIIEMIYKKLNDDGSVAYSLLSQLISFALLLSCNTAMANVIVSIFAVILVIINMIKGKEEINAVPLICLCPFLYLNGIFMMSIWIGLVTIVSLARRKFSMYTVFSGIYLLIMAMNGVSNTYIREILFICWTLIHYVFILPKNKNERNIFKFLFWVSLLFIYRTFIKELGLAQYTAFSMLGYIVLTILSLKKILVDYVEDMDTLEYFVFAIIYLMELSQYLNETDGMLFGFMIAIIIILSYIKKYGAIFMVSVVALLINVLLLTREFWFSIPWWIYLLAIGILLIGFAVRNEVSDKKNDKNVIDMLKSIKDNIDK